MGSRFNVERWNGGESLLILIGAELNLMAVRWLEEVTQAYCLERTRLVAIGLRAVRRFQEEGMARLLEIVEGFRQRSGSVSLVGLPAHGRVGEPMASSKPSHTPDRLGKELAKPAKRC